MTHILGADFMKMLIRAPCSQDWALYFHVSSGPDVETDKLKIKNIIC